MRLRERVSVTLAQTQVDDVDEIRLLPQTYHEVVRLYVSVNEQLGVEVLHSQQHLLSQHANSLQSESAVAVVEQVFQTGTQQFHHHHIKRPFHSIVVHQRDPNSAL